MATARLTLGSVFGTVASTANTITDTAQTISSAVLIGKDYVEDIRTKNQIKYKHSMHNFENEMIEDFAQKRAEKLTENAKRMSADPTYADFFKQVYNEHKDLLNKNS